MTPTVTRAGGFQGTGTQATHNGAVNYNRILSNTLITEVRLGVNRYRNDAQQVDYGTSSSNNLGVPGVHTSDPFVSGPNPEASIRVQAGRLRPAPPFRQP